jgi:hypothetical protein
MPDVAGRWLRSLLGVLGGGKLYILGVAGYNTPIWDVLALQGVPEEAGEHNCGAILINFFPIRQAVPGGLAWARFWSWAHLVGVSGCKNLYSGSRIIIIIYPTLSAAIGGCIEMENVHLDVALSAFLFGKFDFSEESWIKHNGPRPFLARFGCSWICLKAIHSGFQ